MAISVALVDDQTLVREGIRSLLALSDTVRVIAEGSDGEEVLEIAKQSQPDVFLLDLRMPKMNGIDAIKAVRAAGVETPIIILTTFDDYDLVLEALQVGAQGYLLKDLSLERLIAAIECVYEGEMIVQPAITDSLLRGLGKRHSANQHSDFDALPEPQALTPKEAEVLRFVAGGYSNKEISGALKKSEGTIKNHVSNILSKLGVRDRTRAVLRAIELGLI